MIRVSSGTTRSRVLPNGRVATIVARRQYGRMIARRLVAALSLLAVPVVQAQDSQDTLAQQVPQRTRQDRAVIRAYRPTVATMERFGRAAATLDAAEAADPALKAEDTDTAQGGTVAEMLAQLKRHPRMEQHFAEQGLSDRDIVLFPLVMLSAMIAITEPPAAKLQPTSSGQVAFYRRHRAALDAIFLGGGKDASDGH